MSSQMIESIAFCDVREMRLHILFENLIINLDEIKRYTEKKQKKSGKYLLENDSINIIAKSG